MKSFKLNLCGHSNDALTNAGFSDFPIQVNLADEDLETKLTNFFKEIGVDSSSVVTLATPGLAPLAVLVIVILHGLTGQFPTVQLLIRNPDGSFSLGAAKDLAKVRNDVARISRPEMVVL